MSELVWQSPLAGRKPLTLENGYAIKVSERKGRGMIDLRGKMSDAKFKSGVKAVLGMDLPDQPRSVASSGEIDVLWLSIDQWLISCPFAETQKLMDALAEKLAGTHHLTVDMSAARTIITLAGDGVREVLMKAVPVDLTGPQYHQATVRRLRFGDVAAMVHLRENACDLYVFCSYANYAWDWLEKTARSSSAIRLFKQQTAPKV